MSDQTQTDHDLLIRVDEKLEILLKQTATINADHETRIRRLEVVGAIAIGISYAAQFYFNFLK